MNIIFYSNSFCKGKLISLSRVNDISEIKDNIVYVDSKKMFDLKEWLYYKPQCILVENSTLFSHIVSYCISIDVAVISIKKNEIAKYEDRYIIIDFVAGNVHDCDIMTQYIPQKVFAKINKNINIVRTIDGKPIKLFATVKNPENAIQAQEIGVRNAGLVCTEFFYSSYETSTSDKALDDICSHFIDGVTYIRLFDYDVDKLFLDNRDPLDAGRGIRAIFNDRLSKIIVSQIKYIIWLSKRQQVTVVIPYVTTVDDVRLVDRIIREYNNGKSLPLSAMIETPASFFSVPQISKYVSSFSIGTNDLLSAFFAYDRDSISDGINYFSPYNWGLLKMLSSFPSKYISRAKVCGQLPLYPLMLSVLISLGYSSFSIPSPMLSEIARRIRNITTIPKSILLKTTKECDEEEKMVNLLLKLFTLE